MPRLLAPQEYAMGGSRNDGPRRAAPPRKLPRRGFFVDPEQLKWPGPLA